MLVNALPVLTCRLYPDKPTHVSVLVLRLRSAVPVLRFMPLIGLISVGIVGANVSLRMILVSDQLLLPARSITCPEYAMLLKIAVPDRDAVKSHLLASYFARLE